MNPRDGMFQVHALTIACTNLERSIWFYETVLGASRIPTDNGVGWWYQLGSLKLSLLPNAEEPSPAEFPTHAMPMLWLEVQDLTAALEWLTAAEVNVVDHDDGLFVMVTDPDGLLIEIWQA